MLRHNICVTWGQNIHTGHAQVVIVHVSHVVQERLSHPEHLTSSSVSSEVRVAPSLVFYVMFCRSSFYVLPFYCLVIVFSILLRFTTSDRSYWYVYVPYLLRENVNHGSFTLWWRLVFLSKQKGKEWPYKNNYQQNNYNHWFIYSKSKKGGKHNDQAIKGQYDRVTVLWWWMTRVLHSTNRLSLTTFNRFKI
jgi:hypothetical protein